MNRKIAGILLLVLMSTMIFSLAGCSEKPPKSEDNTIVIAEQYGLAYAPILIMKEKDILKDNIPDAKIEWAKVINTAAIREGMIADKIDIGFMAIPPFLIGWDKGMDWKIACGLSSSPVELITYNEDIKNIGDLTSTDRIALPQPGSIQHILLSMASEKELGDPHKFDNQLVMMSHPDGMNALMGRQDITAHFTTPPYVYKELKEKDMHSILSAKDIMGEDFSFIVGATTEDFYNNKRELYQQFIESLEESIKYINENPEESAEIIALAFDIPEKEALEYLTNGGMKYHTKVKGLKDFSDFMNKQGYINKTIDNIDDVMWEREYYEE
ncbi:ABC transporter substrate-binding protein [Clostridiisalibacter paucivorans]|uniref:ABC transporter substrate-binding protein n=1 Tax=Clostridiisalibacter paucivorans TaxID=408753 RepID=UPI00047E4247|nr:ABC transporter substrate-binding protein [Clostridiisalibacter paucivorans]